MSDLIDHHYFRPFWPTTLGDARRLIERTFEVNGWEERSRNFYMNRCGVRPQQRAIIGAMGRARMIIFADRPPAELPMPAGCEISSTPGRVKLPGTPT